MTRVDLSGAIMAWLHRLAFRSPVADFDAVSSFIQLCEEDVNKRLRSREMVTRVTTVVDAQYITLPCDYLEAYDVRLQNGPELQYQPRAELANMYWGHWQQIPGDPAWSGYTVPSVPWNAGMPAYYSVVGSQMELSPFPETLDAASQVPPLELAYYKQQALGPDDTDTTPVLSLRPSVYLYGSLIQSAPFLRDDSRLQTWGTFYEGAISSANEEHSRARTQGSRLRQRYARLA
jgi:hypothetical protein